MLPSYNLCNQRMEIYWLPPKRYMKERFSIFQFFLCGTRNGDAKVGNLISEAISVEENDTLIRDPTEEELKAALLAIPKNSTPGPDGFGSHFFIACQDFVKKDLLEAAKEFFQGVTLPRFFSSLFIVLISKLKDLVILTNSSLQAFAWQLIRNF